MPDIQLAVPVKVEPREKVFTALTESFSVISDRLPGSDQNPRPAAPAARVERFMRVGR